MDRSTAAHPFWKTRSGMAFIAFLSVAIFFLLTEHTAHALGALPFLLLLACPLMHLFHHGGHHHDHSGDGASKPPDNNPHGSST